MSTTTTKRPSFFPGRRPLRLSVEKYEAMVAAGIFGKYDRIALIEGELVEKMTQNPPHSMTVGLCDDVIAPLLPAGWHNRQEKPIRIPTRDSEPEPDLAVTRGKRIVWPDRHPGPDDLALVVEVADSTVDDDRAMAVTYGGGRVPAYWLVNIPDRQIELYTEPSGPVAPVGYRRVVILRPGDFVPLVIDGREIARVPVTALLPLERGDS